MWRRCPPPPVPRPPRRIASLRGWGWGKEPQTRGSCSVMNSEVWGRVSGEGSKGKGPGTASAHGESLQGFPSRRGLSRGV